MSSQDNEENCISVLNLRVTVITGILLYCEERAKMVCAI